MEFNRDKLLQLAYSGDIANDRLFFEIIRNNNLIKEFEYELMVIAGTLKSDDYEEAEALE